MYCFKCGCELIENAKFCYKCGNKLEYCDSLHTGENAETRKEIYKKRVFQIGKNRIVFEDGMCEYIEVRRPFEEQASENKVAFKEWYVDKIKSFDDFVKYPIDKINELLELQVDMGVDTLFRFGIDYVDKTLLVTKVLENNDLREIFQSYTTGITMVMEKIENDAQERKYRQRLRGSRWRGGGFGISGAIQGSIEASVMNIGSRALGTIPEALNKIVSSGEVDTMKDDLIREEYVPLAEGVYELSCKVFDVIVHYLQNEKKIIYLDTSDIEKREVPRLNNYMQLWREGKINKQEAINKITIGLKCCPFHLHFYRDLYILDHGLDYDLLEVAQYTGSTYEYERWKERIRKSKDT